MKVLIIVPAFNEAQNLHGVVRDLRDYVPEADILVVDDGSTDDTARVAAEFEVALVQSPFNRGIGATMQTGYVYAEREEYDVAVQFDGDGQHRADQVPGILGPVLTGAVDVAIGSRFLRTRTHRPEWPRLLGIRFLSAFVSVLVGRRVTDPTSGFRAANRDAIAYFASSYPDDYPEPETVVLLHRAGFRFEEVPVLMRERQGGASTITWIRGLYYMIKVVLAICVDMIKVVNRPQRRQSSSRSPQS